MSTRMRSPFLPPFMLFWPEQASDPPTPLTSGRRAMRATKDVGRHVRREGSPSTVMKAKPTLATNEPFNPTTTFVQAQQASMKGAT